MSEGVSRVERARFGDLTGLSFAGDVRMSFEVDPERRPADGIARTGADLLGRDDQERRCRAFVEGRGGRYIHTYEEPDTSAWKRKRVQQPDGTVIYRVIRPVYQQALADLRRGIAPNGQRLDGLIVADIDRLTRDNRDLEDAIDAVTQYDRPIIDPSGTLDLLTDNGRTVARIVVATKNQQSADTARRVRDKHHAMQRAGIPTGGTRPFGWQPDKRTLDPAEADVIREAARRILAGAPLSALVVEFNARGVRSATGKPWRNPTLKGILRSPRICGYRARYVKESNPETGTQSQRVEIVRDDSGSPVMGQWEPILSVTEWEAVTALIGSNVVAARGANARKYLLTGILRCGRDGCGGPLRAQKVHASQNPVPDLFHYSCTAKAQGGCGGRVSIHGPRTDERIRNLVILKYEKEAASRSAAADAGPWPQAAELEQLRQDMRELTAAWRARQISGSHYFAQFGEVEAEHDLLAQERDRWLAVTHAAAGRPVTITVEQWDGYTLAQRRAYVEDVLHAVIVHPAQPGWDGFDPNRLEPIWR
jgi:site-specific DNA recombinase